MQPATPIDRAPSAAADAALLDWVRHYALVLVIVTLLGAILGLAWGTVVTPRAEMWSIVVDTEHELSARQLGVVAETLFRAEETYRPALTELGLDWTPDELFDRVELRAVPESRLLIVTGWGDDTYSAAIVSDAMARSLTEAFDASGLPGFRILGAPQPPTVPSTVSLPVFAALGGVVGLLLVLGLSIVHFRTRRPVLAIGVATDALAPDDVVSVPQRRGSFGVLRHALPVSLPSRAATLARRRLDADTSTVALEWPGVSARRAARLAAILRLDVDPEADQTVVVAEPASRLRDLDAGAWSRPLTLLWLA